MKCDQDELATPVATPVGSTCRKTRRSRATQFQLDLCPDAPVLCASRTALVDSASTMSAAVAAPEMEDLKAPKARGETANGGPVVRDSR